MRELVVGSMVSVVGSMVAVVVAGCRCEHTGSIAGPPLMVGPGPATSESSSPPIAAFADLDANGVELHFAACHEVLVTAVTGTATAAGQPLATGDVLAVRGLPEKPQGLSGHGLALVVDAQDSGCVTRTRVVRAGQSRELTFMGGAMRAHLDVDDRDVASFYFGRLAGTAGVPEHAHDQSWEILCAVEASGTFTLDGKESHLGSRTCVSVPPGTKHSWRPDPGSNLVALQVYSPPGPEQRFKKLAADDERRRDE